MDSSRHSKEGRRNMSLNLSSSRLSMQPSTPLSGAMASLTKARSAAVVIVLLAFCFATPAFLINPAGAPIQTTSAGGGDSAGGDVDAVDLDGSNRVLPLLPVEETAGGDQGVYQQGSTPLHYASIDTSTPFRWTAGGVQGKSEDVANFYVGHDHQHFLSALKAALGINDVPTFLLELAARQGPADAEVQAKLKASMLEFIADHVQRVANNASHNPDCLYHLLPNLQWMCHMWGATTTTSSSSSNAESAANGRFLHLDVMRKSLCSLQMSCAAWRRGTFSAPLSPKLLHDIFQGIAATRDEDGTDGAAIAVRNLVHGGDNLEELRWLGDRAAVEVNDIAKRKALFLKAQSLKRTLRKVGTTDARAIFQGGEIGLDPGNLTMTSRGNGSPTRKSVRALSPTETMAILYHRATIGGTPSASSCSASPPIHLIIFSGDSLTRELFNRLVHHLRYGAHTPTIRIRNPASESVGVELPADFRWMPFFEVPAQEDFIYAVYPTHDDYSMFSSVAHDHSHRATVNRYFIELAARLQRQQSRRCGGAGPGGGPKEDHREGGDTADDAPPALMYVVFLWDPFTQRPRRDPLAPCASPLHMDKATSRKPLRYLFFRKHKYLDVAPRIEPVPLRSLGGRIGLHVHGAAYWERVQHPDLLDHWASMALDCKLVPSVAAAGTSGDGHVVAPHPTSDDSYLYLLTSAPSDPLGIAKIPPHFGPPLVAPLAALEPSSVDPLGSGAVHLTDERIIRTHRMFSWLKDLLHNESVQRSTTSASAASRFYSRVRLLDKGKVPYVPGNVFARVDGTHLSCHGYTRLFGNTLQDSFYDQSSMALILGNPGPTHSVIKEPHHFMKRLRDVLLSGNMDVQVMSRLGPQPNTPDETRGRKEPFGFLPLANGTRGYMRPEYRQYDQCGDFGNMYILNVMMHDILMASIVKGSSRN